MKRNQTYYSWLSWLAVVVFSLYWVVVFLLAMPPGPAREMIAGHAPRFKMMFGYTWKLFTPPPDYNSRLYIVVKDISGTKVDSTEVLVPIMQNKQRNAPFNQHDYILDCLVNLNVTAITTMLWHSKKIPLEGKTQVDSLIRRKALVSASGHPWFKIYVNSINNYCNQVIKAKKMNVAGNEWRYVITQIPIRPFSEMGNAGYHQKEILVFETNFVPCLP